MRLRRGRVTLALSAIGWPGQGPGVVGPAAQALGMSRSTLWRKMRELGLGR